MAPVTPKHDLEPEANATYQGHILSYVVRWKNDCNRTRLDSSYHPGYGYQQICFRWLLNHLSWWFGNGNFWGQKEVKSLIEIVKLSKTTDFELYISTRMSYTTPLSIWADRCNLLLPCSIFSIRSFFHWNPGETFSAKKPNNHFRFDALPHLFLAAKINNKKVQTLTSLYIAT